MAMGTNIFYGRSWNKYHVDHIWFNSYVSPDDIYELERLDPSGDYVYVIYNGKRYYSQYINNDSVNFKKDHWAKAYTLEKQPLKEFETHHWADNSITELPRHIHNDWHKFLDETINQAKNTEDYFNFWLDTIYYGTK